MSASAPAPCIPPTRDTRVGDCSALADRTAQIELYRRDSSKFFRGVVFHCGPSQDGYLERNVCESGNIHELGEGSVYTTENGDPGIAFLFDLGESESTIACSTLGLQTEFRRAAGFERCARPQAGPFRDLTVLISNACYPTIVALDDAMATLRPRLLLPPSCRDAGGPPSCAAPLSCLPR